MNEKKAPPKDYLRVKAGLFIHSRILKHAATEPFTKLNVFLSLPVIGEKLACKTLLYHIEF